jgi:hypothetical protein
VPSLRRSRPSHGFRQPLVSSLPRCLFPCQDPCCPRRSSCLYKSLCRLPLIGHGLPESYARASLSRGRHWTHQQHGQVAVLCPGHRKPEIPDRRPLLFAFNLHRWCREMYRCTAAGTHTHRHPQGFYLAVKHVTMRMFTARMLHVFASVTSPGIFVHLTHMHRPFGSRCQDLHMVGPSCVSMPGRAHAIMKRTGSTEPKSNYRFELP